MAERQVLAALKLRTRVSLSVLGEALRHLRGEARRAADGGRPGWIGKLILSEFGEPRPNLANAITALRHAPEWRGVLGFDEFRAGACLIGHPPWGGFTAIREWTETDDRLSTEWLQRAGIDVRPDTVSQAVETVARESPFHPVRDYLSSIAWDGQRHLARSTRADRALAPAPAPHGQLLLAIEPLHARPVDGVALPPEQDVQAPVAEPPAQARARGPPDRPAGSLPTHLNR